MSNEPSTGRHGGPRANTGAGAVGPGSGDERPHVICTACQRPIEEDRRGDWRGEPVHFECGAELRCGVSIGPTASEE